MACDLSFQVSKMLLKLQVSLREKFAYEILVGTAPATVLEATYCSLVQNLGSDAHGASCINQVCGYIRGKGSKETKA